MRAGQLNFALEFGYLSRLSIIDLSNFMKFELENID